MILPSADKGYTQIDNSEVDYMKILETKSLTKYYGKEPNIVKALDGVDISVYDGEFVAVVGTSGSGKSTLLHVGRSGPTHRRHRYR